MVFACARTRSGCIISNELLGKWYIQNNDCVIGLDECGDALFRWHMVLIWVLNLKARFSFQNPAIDGTLHCARDSVYDDLRYITAAHPITASSAECHWRPVCTCIRRPSAKRLSPWPWSRRHPDALFAMSAVLRPAELALAAVRLSCVMRFRLSLVSHSFITYMQNMGQIPEITRSDECNA